MSKKNAAQLFGKTARKPGPANVSVEWKLPEQYVGLELEIEQTKGTIWPEHFWPNWTQTRDGSLRNGREYVLSMPLKGDALSKAIANLFHASKWDRSTTGSSHIHLDMMEENTTVDVIKVLTLLIYSMEDAIFRYLGVGREWCGFTNKLSSAPDSLIAAVLNSEDEDNYRDLYLMCHDNRGDIGRYYGLNLMALSKHNTVEFRYFPTATTQEDLIEWVQLVMSFKKAAVELGTVDNLRATFSNEDSYFRFVTTYFAEWADKFLAAVPYYRALGMIKKAMAIAESRKTVQEAYQFNPESITASPVLARFAVIQQPAVIEYNFIMPEYHGSAPPSSTVPANTIMLYQSDFYLASRNTWLLHADVVYEGTIEQKRIMHYALTNQEITRSQLISLGYGQSNATYAIGRQAAIAEQLAASLGIAVTNPRGEDTAAYVRPPSWHPDEDEPEMYEPEEEDDEFPRVLEEREQGIPVEVWPTMPPPAPRRSLNDALQAYMTLAEPTTRATRGQAVSDMWLDETQIQQAAPSAPNLQNMPRAVQIFEDNGGEF